MVLTGEISPWLVFICLNHTNQSKFSRIYRSTCIILQQAVHTHIKLKYLNLDTITQKEHCTRRTQKASTKFPIPLFFLVLPGKLEANLYGWNQHVGNLPVFKLKYYLILICFWLCCNTRVEVRRRKHCFLLLHSNLNIVQGIKSLNLESTK